MSVYLNGLALRFYRGIGSETQFLAPFKRFNFFIGANNAGKSTVLNFISQILPRALSDAGVKKLSLLEQYRGAQTGEMSFQVSVPIDVFVERGAAQLPSEHMWRESIRHIAEASAIHGQIWLSIGGGGAKSLKSADTAVYEALFSSNFWYQFWNAVTRQTGGGLVQHWIPETLQSLANSQTFSLPAVRLIPSLRQIGPKGSGFQDFTGTGLIDRLAEVQSPDHDKRFERAIFDKINVFLRSVTDRSDATIEVPHNREHLLVHMDNKVLPLSSLGMGIHQVVMIAAFCTLSEEQIICIEEPEIHLHPLLQRKLVRYLSNFTSNQYFIATHSAAFIDTPDAAIFHVINDGVQTRIRETVLRRDKFDICTDLGYRASDIVQANAVIWVEGPSDRIYIKHWIRAIEPNLIEGIHYSIMFYGGRLLSHLSVESEELGEFIALRSLNQNLAIVIDSDKQAEDNQINETKRRIQVEFKKTGLCWITAGREIENYIPHEMLQEGVRATHPSLYEAPMDGGPFDHALYFRRSVPKPNGDRTERNVDKVGVARAVCDKQAELNVLDVREQVLGLVEFIRKANEV